MNHFDAAVDWLVTTGRAKSRGEARRNLMEGASQVTAEEFGIPKGLPDMSSWLGKIAGGIAGASPAIYKASDTLEQLKPRPWWKRIFGA